MRFIEPSCYLGKESEKILIIALSGGADSVCLTHFLKNKQEYKIILAHFNHHIRLQESDRDEEFVRNFALKLKLPFEVGHWENPQKSEEKARKARYVFLRKIQKKYQAQAICLGHHQDDQIETIFFNFVRGSGLKGLGGIPVFENQILRPLLNCTKKEILDYCQKHKLDFVTDQTNFDLSYSRNLLRLQVFPELEKINPKFKKTILRNSQNYQKIQTYLQKQIQPLVKQNKIKIKDFLALDSALQMELIQEKIKKFTEPKQKKVLEILKIIRGGRGNKYKKFDKIKVSVNKGEIFFEIEV